MTRIVMLRIRIIMMMAMMMMMMMMMMILRMRMRMAMVTVLIPNLMKVMMLCGRVFLAGPSLWHTSVGDSSLPIGPGWSATRPWGNYRSECDMLALHNIATILHQLANRFVCVRPNTLLAGLVGVWFGKSLHSPSDSEFHGSKYDVKRKSFPCWASYWHTSVGNSSLHNGWIGMLALHSIATVFMHPAFGVSFRLSINMRIGLFACARTIACWFGRCLVC